MEDPNSDDWLPPGWTVDVRVRKNGKRDKYYFSPSSEIKFNSKVEVFRHLDNAQNKVSVEKISPNVIVEKGVAEGFPPGWMKKTRITTKEDTVRRDSYYIDPVSGYAFRSIKDVERYLESGKIGRNAFKPKDKGSCDVELNTDKSPSASVTMKPPTLPVSIGQNSDWDMIANDQQIPRSASSGEHMHMLVTECISSMVGPELASSVLSRAESSDQKEGKVGLAQGTLVLGCSDGEAQEKQFQESSEPKYGMENVQARNRQRKHKQKKEINLPRRASKRLAGIKLDPVPELVTRSRARHVAVKQSGEGETVTNVDISPNGLSDGLARQVNALEEGSEIKCNSEKHPEKTLEVHRSDKDNKCFSFLPPENNPTSKDCVRILENEDKVELENLDYNLDIPLTELLTDPCIAFAFETLTGITLDPSKNSQTPSELKTSHHSKTPPPPPPPAAAVAEGLGNKNNGLGDNVFLSQENFAIPQEHAGDAKAHDNKANNENAGPSSENTLDMSSWTDPYIEFAIKTLTGTIPIDSSSDQNPKNCLQQQLSPSNNQHSDGALPSVSLDNCCNQYFGIQKPMFTQPFVDPSLQPTRNLGLGNSAGARLPHCGEDNRRNVC